AVFTGEIPVEESTSRGDDFGYCNVFMGQHVRIREGHEDE
ncbi:hypothetical protein KIPB_014572, partial [Kipferlia bialata]